MNLKSAQSTAFIPPQAITFEVENIRYTPLVTGPKLKQYLREKSIAWVARKTGLSRTTLQYWLAGKKSDGTPSYPSIESAILVVALSHGYPSEVGPLMLLDAWGELVPQREVRHVRK